MPSTYPLAVLAQCAEREVNLRRRVYPVRVANGRMTQALADRQIAMMEAIAARLKAEAETEAAKGVLL
jgi:hypothetical protein